jgi:hypothetical protein
MKARINEPLFMPPGEGVGYVLRICAEITVRLRMFNPKR